MSDISTAKKASVLGIISLFGFVSLLVMSFVSLPHMAGAASPAGYPAQVATTSLLAVGPSNNMFAFGTTTRESAFNCAARVISTDYQPIRISFASLSSTTLSTSVGIYQPASTTVAYDAGIYGCGYVTVRGLTASTTIQLVETR